MTGFGDRVVGQVPLEPNGTRPGRFLLELTKDFVRGDDLYQLPPKEPLIEGWLDRGDFAVMYGPPAAGKSFIALDMAGCVATGSWWHGAEIHQGTVLYLIAEGAHGMGSRWRAWKDLNKIYRDHREICWLPRRVNLRAAHWAGALAEAAAEIRPVLIVIDTVARTFGGGNENASEDMGAYIAGVDLVREATTAAVVALHHTGKDQTQGSRGHSSLQGAVDVEIAVRNAGGIITLESTKQKDAPAAQPMRFVLAPAAQSVALAPYRGRLADGDLTQNMAKTLEVLESIATATDGIPVTVWREETVQNGVSRSGFYASRKLLVERNLVWSSGVGSRAIYGPRSTRSDDADG